jgi:hypothetical protein
MTMSAKSRPSLASLGDRLSRKEPAPIEMTPPPAAAEDAARKDPRVQVLVRMLPDERKALRQIALNQNTTVQALVEDALRDLLRRHNS